MRQDKKAGGIYYDKVQANALVGWVWFEGQAPMGGVRSALPAGQQDEAESLQWGCWQIALFNR